MGKTIVQEWKESTLKAESRMSGKFPREISCEEYVAEVDFYVWMVFPVSEVHVGVVSVVCLLVHCFKLTSS